MKRGNSWIWYISRRFGSVDSRGRSALTSLLSVAGIAFGVMTLIVILSVMNGFQMGYIDSILEIHSYHVRIPAGEVSPVEIAAVPGVRTIVPFSENQVLIQGAYSRQSGALLRGFPADILERDTSFSDSIETVHGTFSIGEEGTVVLGNELARMLGVTVGDTVTIVASSGSSETDLFPENADLRITGTIRTGYYEIDSTVAFVSDATQETFGGVTGSILGIKLNDRDSDNRFIARLQQEYPDVHPESWRSFNRSFFGALRIEKNMLLFLVILIFLVVTVNIYHGMRRSVYERREEISVLSALGATPRKVQNIFIINGLVIGFTGAAAGLLCGLFLTVHINGVFSLAETLVNGLNTFISALIHHNQNEAFSLFSPEYFYMQEIPVRVFFSEVLFVFVFGLFSATAAAWKASSTISSLKPAEVLRYE